VVTLPVNRWLIGRGKGHAVVHQHAHADHDDAETSHADHDHAEHAGHEHSGHEHH